MKAIAKVVSPPPALFGMVQWNRYIDQGKTISMMGMIDFWPEKIFERFFVRQGFPPFSEGPFLSEQFVVRDRRGACLPGKLIPFPRQATPWRA
jgi:hypothetical protein